MRKISFLVAILMVMLMGCREDDDVSVTLSPSALNYAELDAVFEGKAMETPRPVVKSVSAPTFSISGGSATNGGEFIEDVFTIVDTTGIIRLAHGNPLVNGDYSLDVRVENLGGSNLFEKVFRLTILPSEAEDLQYIPLNQVLVRGSEVVSVVPDFKGSHPAVFILEGDSPFVIDEATGVISLPVDSNADAGNYQLTITVTNDAGSVTFENVVTVLIETEPYSLAYNPDRVVAMQGQAVSSGMPSVSGTNTEVNPIGFELGESAPDAFSIEETTGRISVAEGHSLAADDYALDVVARNAHGFAIFNGVLVFEITKVADVEPSNLVYSVSLFEVIEGYGFSSDVPTIEGTSPITFKLLDDFGFLSIDVNSGVITLPDGHGLASGGYEVNVIAENQVAAIVFESIVTFEVAEAVIEQVFVDGWENLTPATGEKRLGNMKEVSLLGEPVQATNNRWTRGWGNWTVQDVNNSAARGALMVPERTLNDDWLLAEYVDLTNYADAELYFSGYSRYGTDDSNDLFLLVSENYWGDVTTADWTEISFESFHNNTTAQDRFIDFSAFDGKVITIALRQTTTPIIDGEGAEDFSGATRTTSIWKFVVNALRVK